MEKDARNEASEPSLSRSVSDETPSSVPPSDGHDTILWRVGAAIASPVKALAHADSRENAGRAPGDLTLLLLLLFVAQSAQTLARAVFIVFHGEVVGGLQIAASQLATQLQWPLIFILGGAFVTTLLAGARRNLGADGDLACVAFIPSVFVMALGLLIVRLLPDNLIAHSETIRTASLGLALVWFVVMCGLAIARARRRCEGREGHEGHEGHEVPE